MSNAHHTPAFERGEALLRQLHGQYGPAILNQLDDLAPELKRWVVEFAFGQVYSRPGLDLRSRQIATLAALVAQRHDGAELKSHIRAGLAAGLTRGEIIEIMMQMAVYAGFPAAMSGLHAARDAFAELDAGQATPS